MKLSVTDTGIPAGMPSLVQVIEDAGFHTYWATEHHSESQSGCPFLLAALAASCSETLCVGTAGVLVGYHSPVTLLEQLRLLQTFFPGRVRFGMASATAGSPMHEALLDGRTAPSKRDLRSRVATIVELVRDGSWQGRIVGPAVAGDVEIWLCGTSRESAELAGSLGISYAYHEWIAEAAGSADTDALRVYREAHSRADATGDAQCAVALRGMCATNETEARQLFEQRSSRPSFAGSPSQVMEALEEKQSLYGADEVIIEMRAPTVHAICSAYHLLGTELESD